MLILSVNLLADISNAASIDYVIKDRQLVSHQTLRDLSDTTTPLDPLAGN